MTRCGRSFRSRWASGGPRETFVGRVAGGRWRREAETGGGTFSTQPIAQQAPVASRARLRPSGLCEIIRAMRIFHLVVPVLFTGIVYAQSAQVSGRITDSSCVAVSGAEVKLRNLATGAERQAAASVDGLYVLPLLPPGSYEVHVKHPGFRPVVQSNIALAVEQRAELNFTLQVGAVTEQIEVGAAVSRLNTVEASQGQVIDNQRIVEMPLNGRNYIDLGVDVGRRGAGRSGFAYWRVFGGRATGKPEQLRDGRDR